MYDYGKNLYEMRKRCGMSQEQVALEAEITTSYYGQIERGTANPSINLLERICGVFRVSLVEIFDPDFTDNPVVGTDYISRQIIYQLENKTPEEKEIILNIVKQINKLSELPRE